ncbi:hypothetical protein CRG98_023922 [Punica granatum]|uniref:THH1/TOM1/TOM3 domain-containing protein n=1 Tax=Punica granatum TaxID=22663 RepID=A0A2I0JJF0_PUNGR|nr:hypothetical protein CRG98_023922 [Punica granatum]
MFSGSAVGGGDGGCSSLSALVPILALACFDGVLAFVAFSQVIRIHLRNQEAGWTRQKVLHLMLGCSNFGYFIFFASTLVAQCERWLCWSKMCGFIFMAYPKILFLAAFLLLLSFWRMMKRRMVVVAVVFVLMLCFAVLIWIGTGKNPIDSLSVAQVYVHFCAVTSLLLGGALGYYGILLFLELRKLRSERSSADMWKVGGLAVVSVLCFTSSALIALLTDSPLFYSMHLSEIKGIKLPVLLIFYHFIAVICVFAKAIHWSDLLEEHALYREPAVRHGLDYEHIQHRARSDSCTVASRFRLRYNVDSGCGLC